MLHFAMASTHSGVADAVPNDDATYKKVSRILTKARLDGRIYEYIVDRSRPTYEPNVFDDPEEYSRVVAVGYHRNYWKLQPNYCELWSEKDAILRSIEPATDEWGLRTRMARGFNSTTRVREVAQTFHDVGKKPRYIFYIGDHDPSGCFAEVEVFRRVLWHYFDLIGCRRMAEEGTVDFLARLANVHIKRLAIHQEDIIRFNLPPQRVGAGIDLEEWFTPQEVGKRFKMHPKTVIRNFRGRLGVIEVGSHETLHKRKRKFMKNIESSGETLRREGQSCTYFVDIFCPLSP
jgi:hypothetical protein